MRIEHGNMKETLKPNAADATDAADAADAVARTEVWIWSIENSQCPMERWKCFLSEVFQSRFDLRFFLVLYFCW